MPHPLRFLFLAGVCAATACTPGSVKTPAASQPVLEGVRLVGRQICGPLTTPTATYAFTCAPLPTTTPSGWLMTPGWVGSSANPQRLHSNRTVVITVSTPSLTDIEVELAGLGGGNVSVPLAQVDANRPGNPGEVSGARQVGVSNQDDGIRKTWQIEVQVSTCADSRQLHIFNRSSGSTTRSAPLEVQIVRDPNEETCVGSGSGPWYASSGGSGVGTPTSPKPPGPCAGGSQPRLFQVCEACGQPPSPQLNNYSAGEYCDWNEVRAVYGYSGPATVKPATCTLTQVASREACEGPP